MDTVELKNWGMGNEVGKSQSEQLSAAENKGRIIIFSILGAVAIGLIFALAIYGMFIRELEAILN